MSATKHGEDKDLSLRQEMVVMNKLGIHARPAAMFVKTANRFRCEVLVEKDGQLVNGKSIMGLLMLAAGPGSRIDVKAEGADAAQALHDLSALLQRKFDED
ncbi:MAG TPA: HPr family phosphocarrier protein [Candidatus Paceibacterota bacterium]|nr:HPr family phosphocarrier protein [Verrucomicrobiota bacterium]HOX03692.1 HPr family phosphocarrier protein [Verrucomicrobiota bacterium]HRZ46600.1 HPr family phosphocarrier protein [Candidatus Paceibacterota bacterium]HRZ91629.1 HPr family phosphocarrier protein [Candidatus Paceibacterota bacterium]